MDEVPESEYDPKEWYGMSKSEWSAFFRFAAYTGAESHYKSVRKHMPKFIELGLASVTRQRTQKGTDLFRKMNQYMMGDFGL